MHNRTSYPERFSPHDAGAATQFSSYHDWEPPVTTVELLYHEFLEVGICRSGSGVLIVAGAMLPYERGDVCVIRPYDRHFHIRSEGVRTSWDFVFFHPAAALTGVPIAADLLETSTLAPPFIAPILKPQRRPGLAETVDAMVQELQRRPPYYQHAVSALAVLLLTTLHRHKAECELVGPVRAPEQSARLMPAVEFLVRNYGREICIGSLARICGVDTRTIHRLWTAAFGMPPLEYLIRIRIAMACASLSATDQPVCEIALRNGFRSLSNFNRQFLRVKGMPPRAWRRNQSPTYRA